ncbi:MAG: hypothetical protein A2537_03600 [Candidatus Magasanikbacteria bacterium RIFOXYD2_FULL_36_9]|uniref:Cytokinin riboside 5'-monophosphate phosphoribohydrolase n=1 Tax=Candidatus Magasanikbacteria bacterium RIFOXYD2_FULL_36_9 TaxID=1798707 RepID=A0A1F6P208_9BACT|nr:MAG: hypothetical protein A2537_03600 [Candidatus Magasanikbacteria bacterium RIFOXYD2_FULL_36_9]
MKIAITLTSSLYVGQEYIDLTDAVAKKLAHENHGIIYGGTAYGMMLKLAESYKNAGGNYLVGVMSKDLMRVTKGYVAYTKLDEAYTLNTISERKDKIFTDADAVLILPGGYGTIEELITVVGGKVNKLFDKPIALYNHNNFYKTLILFFNELQKKEFSKIKFEDVVYVSDNLDDVLKYFKSYKPTNLADKFM